MNDRNRDRIAIAFLAVLTLFVYVLVVNNYLGNSKSRISADGIGYYEYLPSLFIYHDLNRKDSDRRKQPEMFSRVESITTAIYLERNEHLVNKYPVGPALLQLPFFLVNTALIDDPQAHDYKILYNESVFVGALCYLVMGLFFLGLLLYSFGVQLFGIGLVQLLTVLATPLVYYANTNASYSHVYSFFAVAGFAYFCRAYMLSPSRKRLFWIAFMLGLVILMRQINVLVVLAVPLLAGEKRHLLVGARALLKDPKALLVAGVICSCIISVQLATWYLQSGKFILYSYGDEGFNFLNPEITNLLFSYRKGLFLYTPLLLITMMVGLMMVFLRDRWIGLTYVLFFFVLAYVFASWWSWSYGYTFGQRVFIDYLPILLIPLGLLFNQLNLRRKWALAFLCVMFIPLNVIQAYQVQRYILHGDGVTKEIYWQVFLRTHEKYAGKGYHREMNDHFKEDQSVELGDFVQDPDQSILIFQDTSCRFPNVGGDAVVQISFSDEFAEANDGGIRLMISSEEGSVVHHKPYILQFARNEFDMYHRGYYNYMFEAEAGSTYRVDVELLTERERVSLDNVQVKYFSKKQ